MIPADCAVKQQMDARTDLRNAAFVSRSKGMIGVVRRRSRRASNARQKIAAVSKARQAYGRSVSVLAATKNSAPVVDFRVLKNQQLRATLVLFLVLGFGLYGGIFLYPGERNNPEGKLRLCYEASPLAFVAEQAGGAATNGLERILDLHPSRLHQRTPLVIGSKSDVAFVAEMLREEQG